MNSHRVILAKFDNEIESATFIEINPDSWLEVESFPLSNLDHENNTEFHDSLHEMLDSLKGIPMTFHTRAFKLGLIKDCVSWDFILPLIGQDYIRDFLYGKDN